MFFLLKIMALTTGRSLLDVGDSQDHLAGVAVSLGWFPTVLDINPRVNDCHFPAICGDFEAYNLGDKRYDCIWASHVFEHFRDPKTALVKCYDLLNDNGVLYVAAPDIFYLMRRYPWGHLHRKEHHIMFSMGSFQRLAELAGFKTIYTGRMNQRGIFASWYDYHLLLHKEGGKVVLAHSLN